MQIELFNNGKPVEWGKPDSFVTAIMCALSMSFPGGEDFFIDSLQRGFADLSPQLKEKWKSEIDRFCKEEMNHSRAHVIHNQKNIDTYGFVNNWSTRTARRVARIKGKNSRHYVASTAAIEHLTTILACWVLQNQHILDNADPATKKLWVWHAVEEINHRKVAIDLYRDLDGSEEWRIKWMRAMYILNLIELVRQTTSNVWRMGGFFKLSTWINAYKIMFSRNGVFRWSYPHFMAYGQRGYHISQQDGLIGACLENHLKRNLIQSK
jgi:predicted metal-dependent hydrolase